MTGWPLNQTRAVVMVFIVGCLSGCIEQAPAAIERGYVIAAQPINQAGENTGAGAVAGVVVGTVAGAAIGGRGAGRVVGAFVGALAGGATGAAAEGISQTPTGIAYTIKLLDGRIITVMEHHSAGDPVFIIGSQIAVETRGRTQHVVRAVGAD